MSRRWIGITGAGVGLVAVGGLAVYFVTVGLERADKIASVVGAIVGLLGLGVAVFAAFGKSEGDSESVRNEVNGTVHGTVVQGKDFHGPINLG